MHPLRWRKMTWVILVFTGLMLVLTGGIIATGIDVGRECAEYAPNTPERSGCETGSVIGSGLGVTALFCVWFLGFIILSIIWFMSRPERRLCPVCGRDARKGQRRCTRCGYDFESAWPSRPAPVPR